jgi:hypothetical protein
MKADGKQSLDYSLNLKMGATYSSEILVTFNRLQYIISQKTEFVIITAVRT